MVHDVIKKILDGGDFSTGGGAAGAITGAMAAALVAMVAALSLKKNYGLDDSQYIKIKADAAAISQKLVAGAQKDIDAFALIKKAYTLPKSTPEEIKKRDAQIDKGYFEAAMVPRDNARLCQQVLELSGRLAQKSNPSAVSDLEAAQTLAAAAVKCCIYNIRINLLCIYDEDVTRELEDFINRLTFNL